jgi:hypothetical protein
MLLRSFLPVGVVALDVRCVQVLPASAVRLVKENQPGAPHEHAATDGRTMMVGVPASDDDAERFFDPRTELDPWGQQLRAGQLLLEALSGYDSHIAAAKAIDHMTAKDLKCVAFTAVINQKRALGMTDEQFAEWASDTTDGA